jgi:hypothetical protein
MGNYELDATINKIKRDENTYIIVLSNGKSLIVTGEIILDAVAAVSGVKRKNLIGNIESSGKILEGKKLTFVIQ